MVGAKTRDAQYSSVPLHDASTWREKAYGKILAVARISKVMEPGEARKSFPRSRSDTGVCGALWCLCLPACYRSSGFQLRCATGVSFEVCPADKTEDITGSSAGVIKLQSVVN